MERKDECADTMSAEKGKQSSSTMTNLLELISQYKHILYKSSAQEIGDKAKAVKPERPVLHGFNGKFSSALAKAGMPKNNGLNTAWEKDRFLDYCKDWQEKNI
jgi:hypothetical protein